MSYNSQWSGEQIDAAIGGTKAVLSELKNWEDIKLAIGYDNPPSYISISKEWKESGSTFSQKYYVEYYFSQKWNLNTSFPSVFFFDQNYRNIKKDYSFIMSPNKKTVRGVRIFSPSNDPILAICTNGGGLGAIKKG